MEHLARRRRTHWACYGYPGQASKLAERRPSGRPRGVFVRYLATCLPACLSLPGAHDRIVLLLFSFHYVSVLFPTFICTPCVLTMAPFIFG